MNCLKVIFKFAAVRAFVAAVILIGQSTVAVAEQSHFQSALVYQGTLICLHDGGNISAWSSQSGKYLTDLSAKLSRMGLLNLAADATKLWAADESALYAWSPGSSSWRKTVEFAGDGESILNVVVVGGAPLLVFPSQVKDPIGGRTFKVPLLDGSQVHFDRLVEIRVVLGTASMLWIGTGYGEWGGHLVGLTPKTAEWVQYYDALHYPTGIAPDKGGIVVSWSMSHLRLVQTMIRAHKSNASVETAYSLAPAKYYQQIAYSSFDKTLYGVERFNIVSIKDGQPTNLAKLHGQLFENEPHAVGVAPGVLTVIPVGPSTLLVVPKRGEPWLVRNGNVTPWRNRSCFRAR
jgi:hypothetical protein